MYPRAWDSSRQRQTLNGVCARSQGIESIFKKIGCEQSSLSSGMMASTAVTESNIMSYLGIIEHRTNQLLQRYQVALHHHSEVLQTTRHPPHTSADYCSTTVTTAGTRVERGVSQCGAAARARIALAGLLAWEHS